MEMIFYFIKNSVKLYIKSGILYHLLIYNLLVLVLILFLFKSYIFINLIWLIIFLSTFLSLDLLFKQDYVDGRLEILYLSPFSLYVYTLIKYVLYWIFCHLPFISIISIINGFDTTSYFCLIFGSLSCTLLGGLNYVLTFSLFEKTLLLSIMVFPLFIPILIFGTSLQLLILFQFVILLSFIIPILTTYLLSKNI